MDNYVIRLAHPSDLTALHTLAQEAKDGMTSLSKNKDILNNHLVISDTSYRKSIQTPGNERYIFVLQNMQSKHIVGTSNIIATVGKDEPFYQYKKSVQVHHSEMLNKHISHTYLSLNELTEPVSEIGGLYLNPSFRNKGVGRFLSLSRFLFVKAHMNRFRKKMIAEMRGVSNGEIIPFWEALGKIFYKCEFHQADELSAYNKTFIKELCPPHPIHLELLPTRVQTVLGDVHPNTIPALNLLLSENFHYTNCYDIFDGGPKLECETEWIHSIANARNVNIQSKSSLDDRHTLRCMIAIKQEHNWLMISRPIQINEKGEAYILKNDYNGLKLQNSKTYWIVPLYNKTIKEKGIKWPDPNP